MPSHPPPTLAPTTIKIVDPSHIKGADKNAMAASPSPPELLLGSGSSHRVTLISRQLEDTYGSGGAKAAKQLQQDTVSIVCKAIEGNGDIKIRTMLLRHVGILKTDKHSEPDFRFFFNLCSCLAYWHSLLDALHGSLSQISVSSTLSNLSSCSRTPVQITATHNGRTLFLENPSRTPPVDYEDPDSGTGDSDHETTISSNSGASTSVATAPSSVTDVECKLRPMDFQAVFHFEFAVACVSPTSRSAYALTDGFRQYAEWLDRQRRL